MEDPKSDLVKVICDSLDFHKTNDSFREMIGKRGLVRIGTSIDAVSVSFMKDRVLWELLESGNYGPLGGDAEWVAGQLLQQGLTAEKYVALIESRTGFRVSDY